MMTYLLDTLRFLDNKKSDTLNLGKETNVSQAKLLPKTQKDSTID